MPSLAFISAHPEEVNPCNPVNMMVVPTPEMVAAMLQLAQSCQNGCFVPTMSFFPTSALFIPAPFSMFFD